MIADNTSKNYKCSKCGYMVPVNSKDKTCPICCFKCSARLYKIINSSDKGF